MWENSRKRSRPRPGSGAESTDLPDLHLSWPKDKFIDSKSCRLGGERGVKGRIPKVFDRVWGPRASPGAGGAHCASPLGNADSQFNKIQLGTLFAERQTYSQSQDKFKDFKSCCLKLHSCPLEGGN